MEQRLRGLDPEENHLEPKDARVLDEVTFWKWSQMLIGVRSSLEGEV